MDAGQREWRACMELDDSQEPLDWEDDLDQAELEDEFDAIAEIESETCPAP